MKVESVLRSINRRLTELESVFGAKSTELNDARALLNTIPGLIKYTDSGKVKGLSRSKMVISAIKNNPELQKTVEDIWNTMKSQGSVSQQAKKYMQLIGAKGSYKKHLKEIQKEAKAAFERRFDDTDIYHELQEILHEIQNADPIVVKVVNPSVQRLAEELNEKFHEKPGEGNPTGMDIKWREIEEKYRELSEAYKIDMESVADIYNRYGAEAAGMYAEQLIKEKDGQLPYDVDVDSIFRGLDYYGH